MLTSADIEAMREKIKRADRVLFVMAVSPQGKEYEVTRADRDVMMEIFDLAAMAARIRER